MTDIVPEKQIKFMKILRANGMIYEDIAAITGRSLGSIWNYCKDVAVLPKGKRRNPFQQIALKDAEKIAESRLPNVTNLRLAEEVGDIDYFIEEHEVGTRFKGPLDKISTKELQKLMQEPTNYHSPLGIKEWADKYIAGPEVGLLKEPPHKFCPTQYEMMDAWATYRNCLFACFRDLGKTVVAITITTREICENRENNYFIMSESKQKAANRVRTIGNILLTNKPIIADYGFLPMTHKYEGMRASWKSSEITVKRNFRQTDPTLMAFSTESTESTGAHFAGGMYDDVWSRSLQRNARSNKDKFFNWYGEMEGCLEDAWELWLLTYKGPNDLYAELQDTQYFVTYERPAFVKYPSEWHVEFQEVEGKKVFKEIVIDTDDWELTDDGNGRFTPEFFLAKLFKSKDVAIYRSEYDLKRISSKGKYFHVNKLRKIRSYNDFFGQIKNVKERPKHMRVIGFFDLAFSQKKRADYNALAIVGIFQKKLYLLETYQRKTATDKDRVDMMRQAYKTFHPFLHEIYVESDLQQSAKVQELQKKAPFVLLKPFASRQEQNRLMKHKSNEERLPTDLKSKDLRIWAQLEGPIEDERNLWVNVNMRNYKEFISQLIDFPDSKYKDLIDAVANCCSIIRKKGALIYALSGN